MEFYNVKLKKKIEVADKDVELVIMKNGRPAAKATVTIEKVKHSMFKILSKVDADRLAKKK
jgi:hypothetical protein